MLALFSDLNRPTTRTRWRTLGISFLILYLLLFSIFALYHIYVANELDDSHGCSIGEWIHLGQQAAVILFLFAVCLFLCSSDRRALSFLADTLTCYDPFKRGPPLQILPA